MILIAVENGGKQGEPVRFVSAGYDETLPHPDAVRLVVTADEWERMGQPMVLYVDTEPWQDLSDEDFDLKLIREQETQTAEAWLESLPFVIWVNWDITDPDERRQAAEWWVKTKRQWSEFRVDSLLQELCGQ